MTMTAGVARVDITPPIGVWLSGFGNRYAPADGIRDPLYSTALLLESDGRKAAIVGNDIIGVDVELMPRIRELTEAWTGIDADHLLVNASHTHCGPATDQGDQAEVGGFAATLSSVPEPGNLVLLALGSGLIALVRRLRAA